MLSKLWTIKRKIGERFWFVSRRRPGHPKFIWCLQIFNEILESFLFIFYHRFLDRLISFCLAKNWITIRSLNGFLCGIRKLKKEILKLCVKCFSVETIQVPSACSFMSDKFQEYSWCSGLWVKHLLMNHLSFNVIVSTVSRPIRNNRSPCNAELYTHSWKYELVKCFALVRRSSALK